MNATAVILLTGALVAASCALLGSFLVLRRTAMLGDAISHAVLPGIVLAYLLTGTRGPLPMLLGAGALGVLTVFLVEALGRSRLLRQDASIGLVFPALFSIGVVLISRYAGSVDLDLDCVLYGEIAYAPWDALLVGGRDLGPKPLWVGSAVLAVNLALVLGLYKELKLSTFDPGLAAAAGLSPVLVHYLLMAAVSLTVVGSFESVGAILVVAMLIVPAATANLLTDRLSRLLILAVAIGVAASSAGYALARWLDASIAGAMAVMAGLFFLLALLMSPRHGVLSRLILRRRAGRRLADQLLLLHLRESGRARPAGELIRRFGWSPARMERAARRLTAAGLLEVVPEGFHLTAAGEQSLRAAGLEAVAHRD